MGQSTDAILFFGYAPKDQEEDSEFYESCEWADNHEMTRMVLFCSDSYPMIGIALKAFHYQAYRGDIDTIDFTKVPTKEQTDAFINLLKEHGITAPPEEVGWKLVSWWG